MDSNTGDKQSVARPGQFVKGDRRINRKGRPKSFDAMRTLAQQIAHEVTADGWTQVESILRKLAEDDPKHFLEIAFGRVPTPLQHSGAEGDSVIRVEYAKGYANFSPDDWDEPGAKVTP